MEIEFAWCSSCRCIRSVKVEPLEFPTTDGKYLSGDIVCSHCYLVIATLFRAHQIVKIEETEITKV